MGKIQTGAYNPLPVVPIVLVGANVNGKPNYMAAAYVNGVNVKPAILYVSLNKKHHTAQGVIENGTFSINVPSADFVIETDYCGLVSGNHIDKSNIFTTFYGELKTAPMIEEFPITCECRYTGQKVEFDMDIVYFGEIIQVYVNEALLGKDNKIDIQNANPIFLSSIENRYRTLGEDVGTAWLAGRQYRPKQTAAEQKVAESRYRCDIVERSARLALGIRSHVSPVMVGQTIVESIAAVAGHMGEKGIIASGAPFVAYHGFDGQAQDIEVGFPIAASLEGRANIEKSKIPGGKCAVYHYVGSYDRLPEVRAALEHWLNANGYTPSGAAYEFYLSDPQTTPPDKLETEIVFTLEEG